MTIKAIKEVFLEFKYNYWKGSKQEKGEILDVVCQTTKLHRKAVIRAFRRICTKRTHDETTGKLAMGASLPVPLVE